MPRAMAWGDVLGDDGPRAHHGVVPDAHPRQDGGVVGDADPASDDGLLQGDVGGGQDVVGVAVDVDVVGEEVRSPILMPPMSSRKT